MKKILTVFVFLLSVFAAFSQEKQEKNYGFQKNDTYLTGSVSFYSVDYNNTNSTNFQFNPSVGYFLSDATSLELGLIIGSNKNENDFESNSLGASLGVFHFFSPENKFSFFVGGSLSYVSLKASTNFSQEIKTNIFQATVFPGVNYFVTDNFALRAFLGALSYSTSKADFQGAESANTFAVNLDLSNINFGVVLKL